MEKYSDRRSKEEIAYLRRDSRFSFRNQSSEERTNHRSDKPGSSTRFNPMKARIGYNQERPRYVHDSFKSSSSKVTPGSSSKFPLSKFEERRRQPFVTGFDIAESSRRKADAKRLVGSKKIAVDNESSDTLQGESEGFITEQVPYPEGSHFTGHSGVSAHTVESLVQTASLSSRTQAQKHKEVNMGTPGASSSSLTNGSTIPGSSTMGLRPAYGHVSGGQIRGLKNLGCTSVPDAQPSGCPSEPVISRRFEFMRKRAFDQESSSRSRNLSLGHSPPTDICSTGHGIRLKESPLSQLRGSRSHQESAVLRAFDQESSSRSRNLSLGHSPPTDIPSAGDGIRLKESVLSQLRGSRSHQESAVSRAFDQESSSGSRNLSLGHSPPTDIPSAGHGIRLKESVLSQLRGSRSHQESAVSRAFDQESSSRSRNLSLGHSPPTDIPSTGHRIRLKELPISQLIPRRGSRSHQESAVSVRTRRPSPHATRMSVPDEREDGVLSLHESSTRNVQPAQEHLSSEEVSTESSIRPFFVEFDDNIFSSSRRRCSNTQAERGGPSSLFEESPRQMFHSTMQEITEQLLASRTNISFGAFASYDRHRGMRMDIDNMSYEELLALEERIGSVSTALSEEQFTKCLRRSIYSQVASEVNKSTVDDMKCSICQEEYMEGDEVGRLPCEHRFHVCCIGQWLRQQNWCPVCKASAVPSKG